MCVSCLSANVLGKIFLSDKYSTNFYVNTDVLLSISFLSGILRYFNRQWDLDVSRKRQATHLQ